MTEILLFATIYLLAMTIAVPISTRLGLGSVLGYLLAGVAIGPVLGVAGNSVTELQHVAEFGVVMMMFLIGLELDPRALWAMRGSLIGLGGSQIIISTLLIMAVAQWLGQTWQVALVLGMVFSLSSTAIVLQTLNEKQLMQRPGGRNAFAVLLTQDIAAIPMLAVMPLLTSVAIAQPDAAAESEVSVNLLSNLPGWAAALATLAAVGLVVLTGRYLYRPSFTFVHSAHLRELDTALALLVVVGIASLMNMVGLSPALGTFLAGVLLAQSEFRHELEGQIAPFKGLLLGLFFVTVGAGMDFGLLAEFPLVVLGATLGVILIKFVVLGLLARVVRMARRDRMLFSLSLAQAGEFGFVLISFALSLSILPTDLARGVQLVIALSMLATPLMFILYDGLSRMVKEDKPETPADDIDHQEPIIIVGIGRFGQVVNRLVTFSGLKTTVLDHDLQVIQIMRRFGFRGYFGDPTRPEVLDAAGLAHARILVVALDDPQATLRVVELAREARPDLHIIARAYDREQVFRLRRAGADQVVRELFDASIRVGRYVLEKSGHTDYEAAELARIYYAMDRRGLRELADAWDPDVPIEKNQQYIQLAQDLNRSLESALMARFAVDGRARTVEALPDDLAAVDGPTGELLATEPAVPDRSDPPN
ncbi:monovalent cation:proton antiporter-2 (CPA2) family protein [Paracoccus pacificus]|uniref:Monovalent cation:proton antiporter-2 (CPA2) family protein n=1 Tax=Paracoccus pacificus TaxID=1463598 RepID=A0ABW4RBM4_9RHOB